MGLNKLGLTSGDRYQDKVATKLIAKMLVGYINGERHTLEIGKEQGIFAGWDDIVCMEPESPKLIHFQVKSGSNNYTQPQKDSMIASFTEVATWVKAVGYPIGTRKFVFLVEQLTPRIYTGVTIQELKHFLDTEISSGMDVSKIADLRGDSRYSRIFDYLGVCDFSDDQSILDGMNHLEIIYERTDMELEAETDSILDSCFLNSAVVRVTIENLIRSTSSTVNAFRPRWLLDVVASYLKPTTPRWTLYKIDSLAGSKAGIHDTRANSIECPSKSVPALWGHGGSSRLFLQAAPRHSDQAISKALIRLSLHLQQGNFVESDPASGWESKMWEKVGGTLGDHPHVPEPSSLNLRQARQQFTPSDTQDFPSPNHLEEEAKLLHSEMSKQLCNIVCGLMTQFLGELFSGSTPSSEELRDQALRRWNIWESTLQRDSSKRDTLFEYMLHPNAERLGDAATMRVGPKTSRLISKGIFMLLVVSVAMGGNDDDWYEAQEGFSMNVIANSAWSGSGEGGRTPRPITDPESVDELLESNKPRILLMSGTEDSPDRIYEGSLAEAPATRVNFAARHTAFSLVTNNSKFRKWVKDGNLDEIRNEIQKSIEELEQVVENQTQNLVYG